MDIRSYIDNSILKPYVSESEVEKFVRDSARVGFYAVCVNPYHVKLAKEVGTDRIKVCSVVGFPLGLNTKEVKVHEAVRAVEDGADEIDMVMNISAFKEKRYRYVEEELKAVKRECGVPLKVIIETCYLDQNEKVKAVEICVQAGVDFVKTSTGFGSGGATVEDVKLIKEIGGNRIKVKAAGGIKDLATAIAMIKAGADRLGTSSGFEIYKEAQGG
ncbi:deoxyribose-phosphate aldolase [Hydrogenivirga caldilitoris]|uniref:Deoxyribose-phosphate aldolase n=1 Tax=Hydrogenivirga caldilitoris TaxID=246264 RepID=A0A497XPX2_9AQUI|nr:deoxyribose-phosphate aldolase [Hydrogenivirga caldilitoris]RLJ70200.1 deoxyribose-phosphate aldolase [Hydrogenivirga caldilitoris]